MKLTAAFASLFSAAAGAMTMTGQPTDTVLVVVLVLVVLYLAAEFTLLALYLSRPADREAMLAYLRARRER